MWTTEKPQVEGWYWYRETQLLAECCHVVALAHGLVAFFVSHPPNRLSPLRETVTLTGEWAGPLEAPL